MIRQFNILKPAITLKPLVAIYSFIHVYKHGDHHRIQANNGSLCIDTDTEFPVCGSINAYKLRKAVKLCKSPMKAKITPAGRLSIISGKFRALIEMTEDKYPLVTLDNGNQIFVKQDICEVCRTLLPFISQDSSREWSRSILFRDGYAYATNNVIIARIPFKEMPNCTIPATAVEALSHLNTQPVCLSVTDSWVGFWLEDGSWLRAQSITSKWPDVGSIINETEVSALPQGFREGITDLIPFCTDPKMPSMYLTHDGITTSLDDIGGSIEMEGLSDSRFRLEPLLLLADSAVSVNLTNYPKHCYFKGEGKLDGVIMGVL